MSTFIGTSGWHYDHWKGSFYPKNLPSDEMLPYYANLFNTVEINATFYHLPNRKTVLNWADSVNGSFIFSVKGSRYITHTKKLKDCKASLQKIEKAVSFLEKKEGPFLFQLPPHFTADYERLKEFLQLISKRKVCLEFRDTSWFTQEIYELLVQYKVAFCIYEFDYTLSPLVITSNFVYIRLHGPKGAYLGRYSSKDLEFWSKKIKKWKNLGKDVYCYFDNDEKGYAPINALELKELLR
ncbi:MAG: DUF72 domain-containing protein [Chlamydiota bacterium]